MKRWITLFLTLISCQLFAQQYSATLVAKGFATPWGLEFIDEHRLLITEKHGRISLLNTQSGQSQTLYTVKNLSDNGQGGLLDVAWHDSTNTLYFTYSKSTPGGTTLALATARLEQNQLKGWQDIFVADAASDTSRHFGSRIAFQDDKLFLTIGDRGVRKNGQDKSNHAGTILRLNLDGSVPEDNPFNGADGRREIWSYGHRNPQGIVFDKPTGQLWAIEHGPRGGDEINLIKKGANYGWAKTSHGKEYWAPLDVGEAESLPGIEDPRLVYTPSIAPASLILYRGDRYPELNGKLLAGALKLTHINVVSISNGQLSESERLMEEASERVRDLTISPGGEIFFSTDNGNIYRLIRK